MIKENTLYFGYGDIAVGHNCCGLVFQNIKPPQTPGAFINDKNCDLIGEELFIEITSFDEVSVVKSLLDAAKQDETYSIFRYKGFTFDFSHYDTRSIDSVLYHLDRMTKEMMWLLPQAC